MILDVMVVVNSDCDCFVSDPLQVLSAAEFMFMASGKIVICGAGFLGITLIPLY